MAKATPPLHFYLLRVNVEERRVGYRYWLEKKTYSSKQKLVEKLWKAFLNRPASYDEGEWYKKHYKITILRALFGGKYGVPLDTLVTEEMRDHWRTRMAQEASRYEPEDFHYLSTDFNGEDAWCFGDEAFVGKLILADLQ